MSAIAKQISHKLPVFMAMCMAALVLPSVAQTTWKPDKTVEIVVTAGAGGGTPVEGCRE